jgi:uncharacterized protein (TIGR04168 family)
MSELAIIGDLHSVWNDDDVRYFNGTEYELLLFTGDLGGGVTRDSLAIARSLSSLKRPALVMLGNNDVQEYAAIAAELTYQRGLAGLMSEGEGEAATPPIRTCGFSAHPLDLSGLRATLIACRPFAMGGNELSFPAELCERYSVASLDDSRDRLRALVDSTDSEHLVFLAHNGPTGLGTAASDPWGRDFGGKTGDWGDRDLADAIAYAHERGRRPLAVIAGHMHWSDARPRRWFVERKGTLYVNAACVPRVLETNGEQRRVHMALTLSRAGAHVRLVKVPSAGDSRS